MRHPGWTAPFRDPHGKPLPGSIAEIRYLRLGGIDQWVMIRGESVANPPLVLLHGGPGLSETALFRHFNAALEKRFTVVYWDQRGAGKTYDRRVARGSMTVDQFLGDLDELVDAVCRRLDKPSVALFGHSWGSALGVLYAARRPTRVAAYAGSGQVGDWAAGEAASYAFAVAQAERRGEHQLLRKLQAIGPPPHDAHRLWTQRTCLQRLEGQLTLGTLWNMGRIMLRGPEHSLLDLPSLMRGFRSSLDLMWAEVSRLDLPTLVPELRMPVYFLLGRRDHWVPPEVSVAYFDALSAPVKQLVWFDRSGHEPFVDEPGAFNTAMVELVRPHALAARDRGLAATPRPAPPSPAAPR